MRSFILLENASDKNRNRIIIFSFLIFMCAVSTAIYYGVLFGLNSFNSSGLGPAEVKDFNSMHSMKLDKTQIRCGGLEFDAYIAKTDEERQRGLSILNTITSKEAMLFVFDSLESHSFWMKNMKFPIDIIWLDENNKIIHIENNISPETYPKSFKTDLPSLYAIEFKAKVIENAKIKIGDYCEFNF